MKKIIGILTLCLCALLVACSDDNPVVDSLQVVSTDGIDFSAASGEGTITVSAAGAIAAASNKDWCKVTVEGSLVRVSVDESVEVTSRVALVTISSGGNNVQVPVVQAGAIALMNMYDLYFSCGYEGGQFSYDFQTNTSYNIEVPEEAAGWLSYTYDTANNQLVFEVAPSSDKAPRGTEVKITAGAKEVVLSISQIEIALDDIAGIWNMSYINASDELLSGETQIGMLPGVGMVLLEFMNLYFPLEMQDNGVLAILPGVSVGQMQGYDLKTTVSIEGGYFSATIPCVAVPKVKDGQLIYRFGYCSSYTGGANVMYPMIYAFSGNTAVGYLEQYVDLEISRPLN